MKPIFVVLFLSFNFVGLFVNCRPHTAEVSVTETKSNVYASASPTTTPPPPTADDEPAQLNNAGSKSSTVSCEDKELAPIWKILADDKGIKELVIESDSGGDCSDYVSVAKKIDLNGDGIMEIFVEGNGNFGSVSTVPIWVIGKIGNDFKVLLIEQGEQYEIKPARTNGYQDLFFPSRRSVWSAFLSTYRFSGEKYETARCQVAFYYKSDKPVKVFNCDQQKEIEKFESDFKFEN